jgi:uncharacterized integral membrane protein
MNRLITLAIIYIIFAIIFLSIVPLVFYPENVSPITLPLGLNLLGFIIILIIINCLIYLMEKQTTNGSNFVICSSNLPS